MNDMKTWINNNLNNYKKKVQNFELNFNRLFYMFLHKYKQLI